MSDTVTLYDIAYEDFASNLYRQIRCDTYGDDLGQTSWLTQHASNQIPHHLQLTPGSNVLEIGCGSGGYAVYLAKEQAVASSASTTMRRPYATLSASHAPET